MAVASVVGLLGILRLVLLLSNLDLAREVPAADLLWSFAIGARFDLIMAAYACFPLFLLPLFGNSAGYRKFCVSWLSLFTGMLCFLAIVEVPFYGEFQQRLNSLVFVYLREDPVTVLSMLWYGFPVLTLTAAWIATAILAHSVFLRLERVTRVSSVHQPFRLPVALVAITALLFCEVVFARGTLRSGPPLRWGDAYHSNSLFANQLALNGGYTLAKAWIRFSGEPVDNYWHKAIDSTRATELVRQMLLTKDDQLVDPTAAVIRRIHTPQVQDTEIRNIVVILLESFSGEYVGALGNDRGVTPEFDKLAENGLLFTRFFSNGTHTHQGMFATLACFPNVPGFEYLMQEPQGQNQFSGIARLLNQQDFQSVYLYNGDFSWDNQAGFFRNQGMENFIGRDDMDNPTFMDPTWGVSDQDMFNQALIDLNNLPRDRPFLAILQTLSNHTPYALPDPLPMEPVLDDAGVLSERLTPMKYSDWALGQFFEKARQADYFDETLFVILGDHGFAVDTQISDVNLLRFHVPLLLLGPGIAQAYGHRSDRVGSQVDVVPTVVGLLGKPFQHQCWGRNLLALEAEDQGIAIIKPSGGDDTVAILRGDILLTNDPDKGSSLFRYHLQPAPGADQLANNALTVKLKEELNAYVHGAIQSLDDDSAGDR